MNYHMLMRAVGGHLYFARELKTSLRSIYQWAVNGLPKKYSTRLKIIDAIERAEIDPKIKQACLDWAKDPNN
tara:strand:- start:79 stop:294 length:216 start_codon:yes stop_codon:yes gene_type:complete